MIRVLIVDSTPLAGNVTSYALQEKKDIRVTGCTDNISEALAQVQQKRCDVVVVNAALPSAGALRLTAAVKELDPSVRVIVTGLPELPEAVLPYVEAGCAGYLQKNASVQELLRIIRLVPQNAALVSPKIAAALMVRLSELAGVYPDGEATVYNQLAILTPREQQVLSLIRNGLSNQEIANRLLIETGTVKNHVHRILTKLKVGSRREAVARVVTLESAGLGRLAV